MFAKMLLAGTAAVAFATAAQAADNVVTDASPVQSATIGGQTFSGYNVPGSSGTTAVSGERPGTATAGDTGSLRISGDRARYVFGRETGTVSTTPSFLLSQLQSVTWDWNVGANGTGPGTASAPVGRVYVTDRGGERVELIWERPEGNGGTPGVAAPLNSWTSVTSGAQWYANLREGGIANFRTNGGLDDTYTANSGEQGYVYRNGSQVYGTLASWQDYFSEDARVIGIGFGAGSGFGSSFVGYVDNVAVTTTSGVDRVNFEAAATAAVPEPATWGLMLVGFGAVGVASRRRRALRAVAA